MKRQLETPWGKPLTVVQDDEGWWVRPKDIDDAATMGTGADGKWTLQYRYENLMPKKRPGYFAPSYFIVNKDDQIEWVTIQGAAALLACHPTEVKRQLLKKVNQCERVYQFLISTIKQLYGREQNA